MTIHGINTIAFDMGLDIKMRRDGRIGLLFDDRAKQYCIVYRREIDNQYEMWDWKAYPVGFNRGRNRYQQ